MLSCQLKQDKKPCFIGFLSKLISLANGISEKSRQRAVVRQCRYCRFLHQGTCRTTVQVAYFSATVSILEVFALGYVSYQGTYRSIVRELWATDPLNRKQPNINFRMSGNSYNIFFILFYYLSTSTATRDQPFSLANLIIYSKQHGMYQPLYKNQLSGPRSDPCPERSFT